MKKDELVRFASQGVEISQKDAEHIVERVFMAIKKTVKNEGKFSYSHFGTLNLRKRKARTGRNPRTGEPLKIKASKTVAFRVSAKFKETL